MSRTKRRLPYSYLRKMKGRIAAIAKGCRKGSIPPNPWDDYVFSRESTAPWRMAWKMGKHGHDADDIAKQLNKTFEIDYVRALNIGKVVEQRMKRGYG